MHPAIQAAMKLVEQAQSVLFEAYPIDMMETSANDFMSAALMLREACIDAPAMDIAGLVRMADHYKDRSLMQKAFIHAVRCRPDFAEVARRCGIQVCSGIQV